MNLEYTEEAATKIRKACSKNRELENALQKKIAFILENPEHSKPLKNELAGQRRVHILKSFVLIYTVQKDTVYVVDFDHHDNVYE
jgi:YafQ family addiction module toxin component